MAIESVSEQYDYIIKSENDARSYRGLIFNQMKVLLISDPTTEQASAALDVNIGNFFLYSILLYRAESDFENLAIRW